MTNKIADLAVYRAMTGEAVALAMVAEVQSIDPSERLDVLFDAHRVDGQATKIDATPATRLQAGDELKIPSKFF